MKIILIYIMECEVKLSFLFQVIGWILIIYGFFSLVQDIIFEFSSKKINHNMKIVVLAKNLEDDLENFSRELGDIKRRNGYKNITLIDMEENDDIHNVINTLEENEINMKVLTKKEGEEYIGEFFKV